MMLQLLLMLTIPKAAKVSHIVTSSLKLLSIFLNKIAGFLWARAEMHYLSEVSQQDL